MTTENDDSKSGQGAGHPSGDLDHDKLVVPCSFAQQRLWVLDQFAPGGSHYNLSRAFRLHGKLDRSALSHSLNEIVSRHEVLRTSFSEKEGLPVQVIVPRLSLDMPVLDLSYLPESEREAKSLQLAVRELQHPFDLERGPLFRVNLIHLGDFEHILLLSIHHIISDGWSMAILNKELSTLYNAFVRGLPSPLTELPIQYVDFAIWQRGWLRGEVLEKQLGYWREQLAGAPTLDLPTDRQRPAIQTYNGAVKRFKISSTLTDSLKGISQRHGVTLFMTILAAFKVLLHRYSQQDDIVVGSPIAGRNRPEIEGLIGFFANTLVLRTDLSGDPTFSELLGRVRKICLDAYTHQDLPFEKLVEELKPERELSRNPLFQVMLSFHNMTNESVVLSGIDVEQLDISIESSKFDLSFFLLLEDDGIEVNVQYNTDLFDESTIDRMSGHFLTLLDGIIKKTDNRLSDLSLLSDNERHQMLVDWNNTATDYPADLCVHQLFESQAALTPDATAVIFDDKKISFARLNELANQLARYLQDQGLGPEALIGICVERSLEMVVGVLGVLKAGCAYVPLDPTYPQERLLYMLDDCSANILITQQNLLGKFITFEGITVCVDRDISKIQLYGKENPECNICPSNLAYVIYTSGSTGKPKGVMIEHHSVMALIDWAGAQFDMEIRKGVLASTSLCFDLSVFELFLPLLKGGTVILVESVLKLSSQSVNKEISLINTVPSAMAALLELDQVPSSARILILAGEFLKQSLVDKIYAHTAIEKVLDLYGPTEDTVYSTCAARIPNGINNIGRPIANTQVYILDRALNPVPIGVAGELYIGGAGLARGYLNQPELTKKKFIRSPFSDDLHLRLYKTGDLARYLVDGSIEYLGRIDHQVKIRGYRIELGEIEAVLSRCPGVREAVVVALEDISGSKRLVSYIVTEGQDSCETEELCMYLKQYLPEYMLPSTFVTLKKLPLTPNGKIDRKALPVPEHARSDSSEAYVPPGNSTEEKLAAIWAEVLKLDHVGINDNFFKLGGHSLLATQVIARANKVLQLEIPLRLLFESPTIAGLAKTIIGLGDKLAASEQPAILARSRDDYKI